MGQSECPGVRVGVGGGSLGRFTHQTPFGHKTLAMSRRYAHLSIANLHEAVSRIATGTTVAPEQIAEAPMVAYLQ